VIIKNCRIFYARLVPERPYGRYNEDNPTWELQIRTNDPRQKTEWEEAGLNCKLMIHKKGEQEGEPLLDEEGLKQWRVNLKKKSKKANGDPSPPVEVVNGFKKAIDASTLGNGSVCNIRLFQREYTDKVTKEKKLASILMGVQVLHHVIYEPIFEEFDNEGQTTVEDATDNRSDTDDTATDTENTHDATDDTADKSSRIKL